MGLFDKAAKKASETVKETKKKATAWMVGDKDADDISKAVKELVALESQKKTVEAKMLAIKSKVKRYADDKFVQDYVARGCAPESPMFIQNADGEKVTYVAQDRSSQYGLKEPQIDALKALLGDDAAEQLLYKETTFGFNRAVLAKPGVLEAIDNALSEAIKGMAGMNMIDGDDAENLLSVDIKTTFRPGTFDQLSAICGKDVSRVKAFLEIAAASFTRYVKT